MKKKTRPKNAESGSPKNKEPRPPFPPQHQAKPGKESQLDPRPKFQAPDYRPSGKLENRVALVTGGDSGIGRAVAVLYAREGADIAITCLAQEHDDAMETCRNVEKEGRRCLVMEGDLATAEFCRDAVDRTVRELGKIDVLVSNAAFQNRRETPELVSDEQWSRTFRVNIDAYFHLVKAALPHLHEGAAIIATSSINGIQGNAALIDYSATKGAINAFTKSLAQSLVDRGIRVNAVAPGPVWTPLNPADPGASPEKVSEFGKDTPYERPAQPEEIAPAYVFFASAADSSYITGEVLTELGGKITAAA